MAAAEQRASALGEQNALLRQGKYLHLQAVVQELAQKGTVVVK